MSNKIGICYECTYHIIRNDDGENVSYCRKEGCYPVHSKCIARHALKTFLSHVPEHNMANCNISKQRNL